jgi:Dynamin GTPase effector domain
LIHNFVGQRGDGANVPIEAVSAVLKSEMGIGFSSNEDQQALEMHWALQAYLKVAMKRICDTVPMALDTEFIKKALKRLKEKLLLGGVTDETLERIVMEDFDVTNKRRETIACQDALLQAKKEILSFSPQTIPFYS